MHHYPFHPGDYMLDTAHLEPLEDLAYRRLLDFYYSSEAPISLETDSVSRRLRLGSEVVSKVLAEFFECRETGWHHKRCDAEIADYKAKADRARENGKRGGRPQNQGNKPSGLFLGSDNNPKANQTGTGSKAKQNQEPEPRTKEEAAAPLLPFPSSAFADAWASWVKHRKEIKKPLTQTSIDQQHKQMASMGEKRAIEMIEFTIRKGWQGLAEPETGYQPQHQKIRLVS